MPNLIKSNSLVRGIKTVGVSTSDVSVFNKIIPGNQQNLMTVTENYLSSCQNFVAEIKLNTDYTEDRKQTLQEIDVHVNLRNNQKHNTIKTNLTSEIKRLLHELSQFAQYGEKEGPLMQSIISVMEQITTLQKELGINNNYENQKALANDISKRLATLKDERQVFINKCNDLDKRSDAVNNQYNAVISPSFLDKIKTIISTI